MCSLPALANQRRRLKICKSANLPSSIFSACGLWKPSRHLLIMARNVLSKDQFVKLIVGAGQASPSPPVGPALGSKGVKSMDFCKVSLCLLGLYEPFMYINYFSRNSMPVQLTSTPVSRSLRVSRSAPTDPSPLNCAPRPPLTSCSTRPMSNPGRTGCVVR